MRIAVLSIQYLVLSTLSLVGGASASGEDSAARFLGRTAHEWEAELESADPQARAQASWAMAQIGDMPLLTDVLLAHQDAVVRFWGIHGLQRIARSHRDEPDWLKAVCDGLKPALGDASPAVRVAAAETLGLSGDVKNALPVLVSTMSDPQDAVRIQAVSALEKLGEAARPAAATLRAATSDSSEYVKRIATRALSKLDTPKK